MRMIIVWMRVTSMNMLVLMVVVVVMSMPMSASMIMTMTLYRPLFNEPSLPSNLMHVHGDGDDVPPLRTCQTSLHQVQEN